MKATTIFVLSWFLLAGCHTGDPASFQHRPTAESVAKRTEQLGLQIERVWQLAAQWPLRSPEFISSIQTGRAAWADYLKVGKAQLNLFASSGIVLDEQYYRLQEKLLDGFSRQWQLIEDIIKRTPPLPEKKTW